jgi:O-antigen/teichoic acid export membrane protein
MPSPTNGDGVVEFIDAGEPKGLYASSSLNQAMGVYLPATLAYRLINFGRILLLTWFMTKQQFGLLSMILLVMNVLTPLCSLGLNEAVTRYVPQYETRGALWGFLVRSFGLLLALTGASVLLICLFSKRLGDFFYAQATDATIRELFGKDAPELAQLSGVVIGLLIVYFYLLAVMKGLRMFNAISVMEMVHGVLFLGLSVLAIAMDHLSAFTLTALYGIALFIPAVYFGFGLARAIAAWRVQRDGPNDDEWALRLLRFSVWTTLAGITWQVLVYYPQWFLNKVHGHEAVAVFSAVRQIGNFILIGAVAVVTVVMTTVTKTWESRGREAAQRQLSLAFRGTGLALLLLCVVLALCKDMIILMFRDEYSPGAAILPLHLLFFLIGAYLAFLPIHFHLIEKARHLFWPWALGFASNVLYAFWLAGPGLATAKQLPFWKSLSPITSKVFTTGFSSPQGLDNSTWCGVFAIATALALCIILINAECTRLDRGTYIIIFSALLLTLKPTLLIAGSLLLILVSFRTQLVFSTAERLRITGYIHQTLRHFPPLEYWVRRRRARQ